MRTELFIRVSLACVACDGSIEKSEIDCINQLFANVFKGETNITNLFNDFIETFESDSSLFFQTLFKDIENANLNEDEEIELISIAIKAIEADNIIDYNEIKLLKRIRKYLKVSDEAILAKMPDKEDYIAQDIESNSDFDIVLDNIQLNNMG
ncbi:MAG: TerB family tellurite resistance protein [bacterium]